MAKFRNEVSTTSRAPRRRLKKPAGTKVQVEREGKTKLLVIVPPTGLNGAALGLGSFAVVWNSFIAFWTVSAFAGAGLLFASFSLPFWLVGGGGTGQVAVVAASETAEGGSGGVLLEQQRQQPAAPPAAMPRLKGGSADPISHPSRSPMPSGHAKLSLASGERGCDRSAVAAGGVRPLWTHRGTAKTTRCARYGGGGGHDPTLNQLWAARGAAKTTRSVQHGGGSRRGPTLMDTPRDCKNPTFRAARRWQRAGSDSDGHPWEP